MCVHAGSVNTSARPRYVFFQSFFDASATELSDHFEETSYRAGFSPELREHLPARLRYLLGR
jgi:hypothetical protein